MVYSAHISQTGPVKYEQLPGSIVAHGAPDIFMPIGMASCYGWKA
jgi:hypothetical protein